MKCISFVLAAVAALGIIVEPVAPSFAMTTVDDQAAPSFATTANDSLIYQIAAKSGDSVAIRQQIASHAERGNTAILSAAQMESLATSNPALYAKLMTAYRSNTMPSLTPDEKKLMKQMTARNLTQFKAGNLICVAGPGVCAIATTGGTGVTAAGWFIFGFMGLVFLLILGSWSDPNWFCQKSGLGWLSGACAKH
jgi:hypothetical protein